MKSIFKHIAVFILILTVANIGSGQSDIVLKPKTDTSIVGYDIPVDVFINPDAHIDSFTVMVLNKKQFQKLLNIKPQGNNTNTPEQDIDETDFEITGSGRWDYHNKTIIPTKGDSNTITLKIWDADAFMIYPAIIKPDSTGEPDTTILFDDKEPILVLPGLNPRDTIPDITPIKNIIKEEKQWTDYKWWILTGLLLLLTILGVIFLPKLMSKNKKHISEGEAKAKPKLPAHIIALKKLEKLKKEQLWKSGKVKEFQSQLTYILREYLENRYNIKALEQTTSGIINALKKINMPEKDIALISDILQIADMVKFAKAKPEEDINERFLTETIDFVNRTKNTDNNKKV